jgi:hypothetical protein
MHIFRTETEMQHWALKTERQRKKGGYRKKER